MVRNFPNTYVNKSRRLFLQESLKFGCLQILKLFKMDAKVYWMYVRGESKFVMQYQDKLRLTSSTKTQFKQNFDMI